MITRWRLLMAAAALALVVGAWAPALPAAAQQSGSGSIARQFLDALCGGDISAAMAFTSPDFTSTPALDALPLPCTVVSVNPTPQRTETIRATLQFGDQTVTATLRGARGTIASLALNPVPTPVAVLQPAGAPPAAANIIAPRPAAAAAPVPVTSEVPPTAAPSPAPVAVATPAAIAAPPAPALPAVPAPAVPGQQPVMRPSGQQAGALPVTPAPQKPAAAPVQQKPAAASVPQKPVTAPAVPAPQKPAAAPSSQRPAAAPAAPASSKSVAAPAAQKPAAAAPVIAPAAPAAQAPSISAPAPAAAPARVPASIMLPNTGAALPVGPAAGWLPVALTVGALLLGGLALARSRRTQKREEA